MDKSAQNVFHKNTFFYINTKCQNVNINLHLKVRHNLI